MAEDKAKSSPDEAEGNDSKVFSLFCLKSILIWLGDRYTLMTLLKYWMGTFPTVFTAITVAYLWTKLFFYWISYERN